MLTVSIDVLSSLEMLSSAVSSLEMKLLKVFLIFPTVLMISGNSF